MSGFLLNVVCMIVFQGGGNGEDIVTKVLGWAMAIVFIVGTIVGIATVVGGSKGTGTAPRRETKSTSTPRALKHYEDALNYSNSQASEIESQLQRINGRYGDQS